MSIWGIAPKDFIGGGEGRYKLSLSEILYWPAHTLLLVRWRERRAESKAILKRVDELSQTSPRLRHCRVQWSVQEADLSGYKPYEPVMDIDLRQASPEVVNAELQRRIDQQANRIEELQKLIVPWGIDLDGGIASLDALNLWFMAYLRLFTKKEFLAHVRENKDPHCDPHYHWAPVVWYSIALDISLYMMSMLQKACPSVHWGVSKQNFDWTPEFNRPVLFYTSTSNAYAEYESMLWSFMTLLEDNRARWDFFLTFRQEYKRTLTACQRQVKKMTKAKATTNGTDEV